MITNIPKNNGSVVNRVNPMENMCALEDGPRTETCSAVNK
jgi:hypothetical protein